MLYIVVFYFLLVAVRSGYSTTPKNASGRWFDAQYIITILDVSEQPSTSKKMNIFSPHNFFKKTSLTTLTTL